MSDMRDEMLRTLDRVVEGTLTVGEREKADGNGASDKLWAALAGQGITALGEADSEVGFADTMALIQRSAFHAVPVPLAESITARRLLARAGIALPDGPLTLCPPQGAGARAGTLAAVPYGRSAGHVVTADTADTLALYDIAGAVSHQSHNQAGEPRDTIDTAKARRVATATFTDAPRQLLLAGALMRSVQLSGALERGLGHSLTWVNERVQFGRPIARFQAIQHALAVMASEAAAARAAVDMAVEAATIEADWFTVAVAKSRAGEAAGKVANAAHAAFGAMGFTREHLLHYTTRRLWAWRDEFGPETQWQAELGHHIARLGGGEKLWAEVTARS